MAIQTQTHSDPIEQLLRGHCSGDKEAANKLFRLVSHRLNILARTVKGDYPAVGRWEQTDDVVQNASMRLWKAISEVEINGATHFYRLAAVQIRRELVDMSRRYKGPYGLGNRHHTESVSSDGEIPVRHESAETTWEPSQLERWHEFHVAIDALSAPSREIVELLFYAALPQNEAAQILNVNVRTVKRRWSAAKIELHDRLQGETPFD